MTEHTHPVPQPNARLTTADGTDHRYLPTVVSVLLAEEDHDRMDCEDDDPRKVWIVVGAWSGRRAVLTHAAPFLDAAETEDLATLTGRTFMCRLDLSNPPLFEHEGGERLEWPELKPTPPMSEVYARLGITPPEDPAAAEEPAARLLAAATRIRTRTAHTEQP